MSWQLPPAQNPSFNQGVPSAPPPQQTHAYSSPGGYGSQQPGGYHGTQPPPGGYGSQQPGGYHGTQPPPGGYGTQPPPSGYGSQPPPTGYGSQPPPARYGSQPPPAGYGAQPPSGYSSQPPSGYSTQPRGHPASNAPPGADPTLWSWFQAVDADHNNSITANELRQALLNSNCSAFNGETCRLMIGMFDTDRNGTINFQEFAALWKYVQDWKRCFDTFDQDRSGNIDARELSSAFTTFGYRLSPQFTHMIVTKFDRKSRSTINFDDFIQVCVMLKSLTDAFKKKDKTMTGVVTIHYEEFLEMVLENAVH